MVPPNVRSGAVVPRSIFDHLLPSHVKVESSVSESPQTPPVRSTAFLSPLNAICDSLTQGGRPSGLIEFQLPVAGSYVYIALPVFPLDDSSSPTMMIWCIASSYVTIGLVTAGESAAPRLVHVVPSNSHVSWIAL